MDLAQTLVRSVMRAFYETRHILIIDALILHSALRDDDMAYLMGMNTKDLHKLCAKLKEDRFLSVYTRPEVKEGQLRPINRTYYYIDYRQTIDAIKWRVYKIDKDMQGTAVPANERKEYFCTRCGSEWTQMEVLDNVSPEGFRCHKCNSILTHDLDRNSVGHQKSTRMNNQFKFITDLLPQIDSVVVPDNTFDVAFNNARPVIRDHTRQVAASIAADTVLNRPTAVKGLADTGPKSMQVSISTSDGPSEAEKVAERARKEKIAQQNALPAWMSKSTITGESFSGNALNPAIGGLPLTKDEADAKDSAGKEALDAKEHADIDDYFARLKAEQAAEEARKAQLKAEEEEFGSDEEDDEGDFEDVVATGSNSNSGAGTPGSTAASANNVAAPANSTAAAPPIPAVPSPLRQASTPVNSLKRDASGSGASTGEDSASPNIAATPGSDGRPVKKVKVEIPAEEAESEDDLEFEDV